MAVLTGENLIDEVRSIVGRPGSTDAGVITDSRVNRWLNEAQQKIVEACPGLPSREIDDATSWYCVSDEYEYDFTNLSSYCAGLQPCHVLELWYRNGNESYQMDYMPLDEFNDEYPDPTHADYSPGKPVAWTRTGRKVRVAPRPSEDYKAAAAGDVTGVFRVIYTAYGRDFTPNDSTATDISMADDGLIAYGTWKAWQAIGNQRKVNEWRKTFSNPNPLPTETYGWLEKFQDKYVTLHEWDHSILFDELMRE